MEKEKAIKILDNMLGEKHIHISDDTYTDKVIRKDNKVIAEFMGYEVKHNKCYSPKYNDGTIAPMQFHTSWDWLMPVVNKCMQTGDNTDEWDALYDALSTVNKTNIYNAVVEFIKQHNK